MSALTRIITSTLPLIPRPVMRRLSARYIAGEELEDALVRMADLAARGHSGIVDVLGEDVADEQAARAALELYRAACDGVVQRGLDAYTSIKPTHFGLRLSPDLCFELYTEMLVHAAGKGQFVRVEMEDHSTTDATLALFARLREQHENVGIVVQSRLFRTPDDIDALPANSNVRLVKGIYLEPAELAHTDYTPIREAFVAQARQLWEAGHTVALATHDEPMGSELCQVVRELGVAPERYWFEVLLGVQERLWRVWLEQGHEVKVYVPYGPEWRSYSQRRLKKNPEIMRHVIRGFFGRP